MDVEQPYQCPYHPSHPTDQIADRWLEIGGDRVCSYCGSWHWEEFKQFLNEAADPLKPRHRVTETTKGYKLYVHRPDIKNAGEGAIKMYGWHIPKDVDEETGKIFREAIEVSFRKTMTLTDQACLDMGMGRSEN